MVAASWEYVEILKELTSAEGCPVNLRSHQHNGCAALHFAATAHNLACVEALLSVPGIDLNIENNQNHTPFQLAFSKKHYAASQKLLESGAKPEVSYQMRKTAWATLLREDTKEAKALATYCQKNDINLGGPDDEGWTLIHWAVERNEAKRIPKLVAAGIDINAVTNNGETALHMAVKRKDLPMVKELITNDANPNCADTCCRRIVHLAIELKEVDIIRYLLENASKYGKTVDVEASYKSLVPVQWAVKESQIEIFDLLVQAGARVEGKELMYFAIRNGDSKTLQHLLEKGMPYEADKDHNTPLILACKLSSVRCIEVLLASSNPVVKEKMHEINKKGDTALTVMVSQNLKDNQKQEEYAKALKSLVESGYDVNWKDGAGQTLVKLAVGFGNVTAVTALMPFYGENINSVIDADGNTLLHLAARSFHAEMIRCLVSLGADPSAPNKKQQTPLHSALLEAADSGKESTEMSKVKGKSREETVTALLEVGASDTIDQVDSTGATATHLAISGRQVSILRSLLGSGALMDSSMLYAAVNEETDVLKTLLGFGPSRDTLDGQCGDMASSTLEKAFVEDCPESFKLLIKAGATVPEHIKGKDLLQHIEKSNICKAQMILAANPGSAGEIQTGKNYHMS